MSQRRSARAKARRAQTRRRRAAALLALAAIVTALGLRSPEARTPMASSSPASIGTPTAAPPPPELPDVLDAADGAVPDGTTVFDDGVPGVRRLDPELLGALRRAAADAAVDGVELVVDSGWRSRAYQEQLLREAVTRYGSPAQAARWVATPETSAHVSGAAVDLGPSHAAAWLARHGAAYGLCPVYRNEPWHYELRPDAVAHGCPRLYADPTHDPRMLQ